MAQKMNPIQNKGNGKKVTITWQQTRDGLSCFIEYGSNQQVGYEGHLYPTGMGMAFTDEVLAKSFAENHGYVVL